MKIGLSFSGGGARAAAHVGVIKALRQNGIEADVVSGTSGGAIVGALYSANFSIEQMLKFASEGKLLRIYTPGIPLKGLTSLDYLKKVLNKHKVPKTFEDLAIPFYIAATNLSTGLTETFNEGKLYQAIIASCSIPLLFKPVTINGNLYVDGGLTNNLPSEVLKPLCDIVIGINVMPNVTLPNSELKSMYGIGLRAFNIAASNNSYIDYQNLNIIIEPPKLSKYNVFNFGSYLDMYEIGYEQTMEQMDSIKAICGL